jgi:hypothetical protein
MTNSARAIVLAGLVLSLAAAAFMPAWSQAPGNAQPPVAAAPRPPAIPANRMLVYRGFTVDATEIRGAPQYIAITSSES